MSTKPSFKRSLWVALAVGGVAASLAACGSSTSGNTGGTGGGGETTTTTSSSSSTSTSSSTTSTSTSSSSTSSSSSSSGTVSCTEISFENLAGDTTDGTQGLYSAKVSPNIGGTPVDAMYLEFYGADFDPNASLDGEKTGTFDLSMNGDNNYATCSRCVIVAEDPDANNMPVRSYFTQSGTLTLAATSDQLNGTATGTITDLTLIEVTIDPDTFDTTPVPNGACLHITNADIAVVPPPNP